MSRRQKERALEARAKAGVVREMGRPTKLTEERMSEFLELIEGGNQITTACHAVGWSPGTFYNWMTLAADTALELESARQDPQMAPQITQHITRHALRVHEFSERVAVSRAKGEVKVVASVAKAIEGGYLIEEEPSMTGEGQPIYDEHGNLAYKRRYAQPDGKLGLEFLSRSAPTRWGRLGALQVEIGGPDGGPIQVESAGQVDSLAKRLAGHLALPAAGNDDDSIIDGEIVGNDDGPS